MIIPTDEEYARLKEMADYQIPRKPEWYHAIYAYDPIVEWEASCLKCNAEIDESYTFCPKCGQRIDWSEDDYMNDHMIENSYSLWKSLRAAADYQIPKEPEKVSSGYADGHPVYDAYCPKCGNELDDGDKVCHECGQLIDWSDGKEG